MSGAPAGRGAAEAAVFYSEDAVAASSTSEQREARERGPLQWSGPKFFKHYSATISRIASMISSTLGLLK